MIWQIWTPWEICWLFLSELLFLSTVSSFQHVAWALVNWFNPWICAQIHFVQLCCMVPRCRSIQYTGRGFMTTKPSKYHKSSVCNLDVRTVYLYNLEQTWSIYNTPNLALPASAVQQPQTGPKNSLSNSLAPAKQDKSQNLSQTLRSPAAALLESKTPWYILTSRFWKTQTSRQSQFGGATRCWTTRVQSPMINDTSRE